MASKKTLKKSNKKSLNKNNTSKKDTLNNNSGKTKKFEDIELKKVSKKAKKHVYKKKRKIKQEIAIIALLINALVIPGIGTIIGKKTKNGISQISLFLGGIIIGFLITLSGLAIIGIPLAILTPFAAWIWGIISGIELIKESN